MNLKTCHHNVHRLNINLHFDKYFFYVFLLLRVYVDIQINLFNIKFYSFTVFCCYCACYCGDGIWLCVCFFCIRFELIIYDVPNDAVMWKMCFTVKLTIELRCINGCYVMVGYLLLLSKRKERNFPEKIFMMYWNYSRIGWTLEN